MRICITGAAGRMGRCVAETSLARGHDVTGGIESPQSPAIGQTITGTTARIYSTELWEKAIDGADVVISFSSPQAEAELSPKIAARGIPLVIGTTGLDEEQKHAIETAVEIGGASCVIAPNYSPLVNAQFALAKRATEILAPLGYDFAIVEEHHSAKKDSPSGTAKKLIFEVKAAGGPQNERYRAEENAAKEKNELDVAVVRAGGTAGIHELRVVGPHGRLVVESAITSRSEFAQGAIAAAEWLAGHKDRKGMVTLNEILGI